MINKDFKSKRVKLFKQLSKTIYKKIEKSELVFNIFSCQLTKD